MAYAAVISLKNTIEHLLNSCHISFVSPSPDIMEFAYNAVNSLRETLERSDDSSSGSRKRVNALDEQIREAVCKLEDVIESRVSNQILSQSEESINGVGIQFRIGLQDLKQDIHSFIEMLKRIEEEYIKELDNQLPEEEEDADDDDGAVSSRIDLGGKKSKMVGLFDVYDKLRDKLQTEWSKRVCVITLVGMAGMGKSTIAQEIFEDPLISSHFDCRAWVTVGRERKLTQIGRAILSQVNPNSYGMRDAEIGVFLKDSLGGRRYLIVLDDVWDGHILKHLVYLLPHNKTGSRVLVTTRLRDVAKQRRFAQILPLEMRLLNKEESWHLLRERVFAEELCPSQLEKTGKRIAENCEGLPLTIIMVANLLSKAERSTEYWSEVATKKNHQLFIDAYDKISKVLYPSYDYLTQQLKMCFLHIGVFPQNYVIPKSTLFNMWTADGFLERGKWKTLEHHMEECLNELISNNVVMLHQESTTSNLSCVGVKTCMVHSSFWHMCSKVARKNNFFHVLNYCDDGLANGIKGQRRLCIHNNVVFGIKEVYNSMENNCASTARSLLCLGPYHQYPVPICFNLRLLRVLDALMIRFYEFPVQVLKLIQLRYLAFTCNGELPASISELWNLQFLIVSRHLSIKSCAALSYLPVEIWDMKNLKHLQIMGSNLPNPCGTSLENLSTLLGVSARSCSKGLLKRIRNLKKLGIQIELRPDATEPLGCLNRISRFHKLKSLTCVVVNPELKPKFVSPPAPLSMFPSGLRKLHLSGLGYSWKFMSIIASLPKLEVLKVQCYAFRGPKCEIEGNAFLALRVLLIEDTDIVQLKVGRGSFRELECISIKHCNKLEELHWESNTIPDKIEVFDCNPLAVKKMKEVASTAGVLKPNVHVHSSWDDGSLKL